MQVSLEYYKVFYQAAKAGSLTEAAREMNISQPAVSQALKQLEKQLGVRLFIRTSRGVHLTSEGEMLYGYVAKGFQQFEMGEKKLAQMMDLEFGELHIGASDMTQQYYLLPYLERFHTQYPGIRVRVNNAPTPETMEELEKEAIDFGVVSGPLEGYTDIEAIPVREIQDIFVAGADYKQYLGKVVDYSILEKEPIISLEKNTSSRNYVDAYMEEHGITFSPEFELATSPMIIQFAMRNLGIGCIVKDFAKEALGNGDLFELRFKEQIPPRHFYIVSRKDQILSAPARKFLEFINEEKA